MVVSTFRGRGKCNEGEGGGYKTGGGYVNLIPTKMGGGGRISITLLKGGGGGAQQVLW